MYLQSLTVDGFRCLDNTSLTFRPGLNVIVGENNTGKSAVIDALRMVLTLGTGRRDIYPNEDDLHHDSMGRATTDSFEIHAAFAGLTVAGVPPGHWRHLMPAEVRLLRTLVGLGPDAVGGP